MEILQNPVTIDCGHNFCLQCISRVAKTSQNLQCPLCKLSVSKNTFRPNKLLASIAEKIQTMDPADMQPEGGESRCQRHKEKLHYFCEKDGTFLCVVCRDSKDHKAHNVTLIDEAAHNYKVQIESQARVLGQKDKEIIEEKKRGEGAIWVFRAQVDLEKLKILEEFKLLRQRLDEEESFLLSRLGWLEQQGAKQLGQYVSATEKQLNSLRKLTKSLKTRLQSSSMVLLKDIKDDLSSELKDNMHAEGKKDKSEFMNSLNRAEKESWSLLQKNSSMLFTSVPVTLDKASADPDLTFSQDLKKVTLYIIAGKASNRQAKPRPFYPFHCVRGSPGISSGCQVWEAEIQGPSGGPCMVGVATASAPGSQSQNLSGKSCIWALRISPSGCQPFTNCKSQEHLPVCLKKVGVYVSHQSGEVVFYDATTSKHIYTFQTSFDGKVFPIFGLQAVCSHITLSP
ncbi:E3 ubiquitin-protein ligase TRIM31 [Apodemus speciosus]|uniref:E3 ubiquitin-protein ligase TRIM31 n=1 Tax=Apodemus speciosus TaxID=105296 RepID=A0ABQ0FP87_APOSI